MPRPSRCLKPGNAPQNLHWLPVGGNATYIVDEMIGAVRASVPPQFVQDAVLDVQALLERVEQCAAIDPDDVVPVASYPYMWELRVEDQVHNVHIRLYIAELRELPNTIIVLHAHAKDLSGTKEQIAERQNQAMSLAALRFEAARNSNWGM